MDQKGFYQIDYSKSDLPEVKIGMLGYGFMGQVHSNAYIKVPFSFSDPVARPVLLAICGRNQKKVEDTARRFGYKEYCLDWQLLAKDPRIDIFNNCTPDDWHYLPSIVAMENGKHVICEKPLSLKLEEAFQMAQKARETGVKTMCCYNYRFLPAIRLARQLIEQGILGKIYQFRAKYLQQAGHNPFEHIEKVWYAHGTQSGTLMGIGSHIIDMAHFLIGEVTAVSGLKKTFNPTRMDHSGKTQEVSADECTIAILAFENGAVGTIESSGVSTGRKNHQGWEINGSKGSLIFDLEDLNHLQVYSTEVTRSEIRGFSNVLVTDSDHPLPVVYLPSGHNQGWEYGHIHALHHFLDCVVNDKTVEPLGATFEDGYKVQVIIEAINQSSASGKWVETKDIG